MDTFQEFFEDAAPRWIASAWDFTGRSSDIDMVWVYMTNEDNAHGTGAYYRVGDRYYKPNDLDQALPGLDTSNEAVLVMYGSLWRSPTRETKAFGIGALFLLARS